MHRDLVQASAGLGKDQVLLWQQDEDARRDRGHERDERGNRQASRTWVLERLLSEKGGGKRGRGQEHAGSRAQLFEQALLLVEAAKRSLKYQLLELPRHNPTLAPHAAESFVVGILGVLKLGPSFRREILELFSSYR